MQKKDILVRIETEVQFFSIKPLLERFKIKNIDFDIFIPDEDNGNGSKNIFDSTYKIIKNSNFNAIRQVYNDYKIVLAPGSGYENRNIKYDYLIRYQYSSISAKPLPVYTPEWYKDYHAILCQSEYEKDILGVYSKTYLVPNLKYINFERKIDKTKKTILYLPTWQDINSIKDIKENLSKLKQEGYYVIAKLHHGTTHLKDEEDNKNIRMSVDELYESNTPLQELMARADIIISDNSAAIYEALYIGIPVVVYGDKINDRKFGYINTRHYEWVKDGIIENPKNLDQLKKALKKSLLPEYIGEQLKLSKRMFNRIFNDSAIDKWMNIINKYLNDDITMEYVYLHNLYNSFINDKDVRISELTNIINIQTNPGIKTSINMLFKAIENKIKRMSRNPK